MDRQPYIIVSAKQLTANIRRGAAGRCASLFLFTTSGPISAEAIPINPALIASFGEFQEKSSAAWQITEPRAPRFTATLHKRVLFDVVEQRCETAFEPEGNRSGLMDIAVESLAGGSLLLL